ncbi:hypothetical protein F4824DRAFT_470910 [Ustulina deusta]|nr:hypothetical protein F4824DRAFT_470910 [Ustulina deusta]
MRLDFLLILVTHQPRDPLAVALLCVVPQSAAVLPARSQIFLPTSHRTLQKAAQRKGGSVMRQIYPRKSKGCHCSRAWCWVKPSVHNRIKVGGHRFLLSASRHSIVVQVKADWSTAVVQFIKATIGNNTAIHKPTAYRVHMHMYRLDLPITRRG